VTPMCIAQYHMDSDKVAKHVALMDTKSWERSAYVAKQGWSKLPGEEEADSNVSRDCANALSELKS